MIQVTSREFRNRQASLFSLADQGEQVIIRRRGKMAYMLTPVCEGITSGLEKKIEEARRQFRDGETIICRTSKELHDFLDAL